MPRDRTQLTPRQAAFVDSYLVDLNGRRAAIEAGYSQVSAAVMGCKLLDAPHVQAAIRAAKARRAARLSVAADEVIAQLARIAFADPMRLFDEKGEPLPPDRIDADTAAAVQSLEVARLPGGASRTRVRLADKTIALTLLARHLGLLADRAPRAPAPTIVIAREDADL